MTRLPGLPPVWLATSLLPLALLAYGHVLVWREWQQHQLLDRLGTTAQAVVTATRIGRGSRGMVENYFVDYRLPPAADPQGKTHSADVNYPTFQSTRQSGVLAVRYLPSHPTVQRPSSASSDRSAALWLALLDVLVIGLAFFILKGA